MKTYGLAVATGFILGIAMVWWVRPDTNAGAVFIVVAMMALCFVAGVVVSFVLSLLRRK